MNSGALEDFYQRVITPDLISPVGYKRFLQRIQRGKLTREDNPVSHTCSMVVAYEASSRKILIVFHKKANIWCFPGGHVEPGELPAQTAAREANEEIGATCVASDLSGPFGAQVIDINNPLQTCKEHYDVFFALETYPSKVVVQMDEFLDYKWLTVPEAMDYIVSDSYKEALRRFVTYMKW